ncbi:MAG: CCA tRNA nucleotidyltransferase [Propionibacteriaceae bacterium]|jgi:poly(A) polymerase|nr:CCA tRNA nucleotidyltransferase [Propionibacteriaceae bacterium]
MPDDMRAAARPVGARLAPVTGRLAAAFAVAGHHLYLVGGPVRDAVLGLEATDLDFTTAARPDQIEAVLRTLGGPIWDVGRQFGTIGTKLGDGQRSWTVEVTTFRADAYRPDSRKPAVRFGDTIEEDLKRRDFTVNAMAVDLADGRLVDPFGGLADLAAKVLRTPAPAVESFSDDPLRMLRAARFAARLQLRPTPEVVLAMRQLGERLEIVSAERVRDELSKLLLSEKPRTGLDLAVRTGLADHFLPELPALRLEVDEHHRHKDVYQHSLTVLDQSIALEAARGHQPDVVNRLAALLHDIGKPKTRRYQPGGKVSFHHHDVVGAKLARRRLTELRYPGEVVEAVAELTELHLRFHGYGDGQWTDSAVRRYVRDAGPQLERLHILTRSDCTTRNQAKATLLRRAYDELEWRIDELSSQEELESIRPELDGHDIMRLLDLPPSRAVGQAYQFLLDLRLDEGPLGEAAAAERLRAWWSQRQSEGTEPTSRPAPDLG